MELISNITPLMGNDLKTTLTSKARLNLYFSMYVFGTPKAELEKFDELSFIFTLSTFTTRVDTDKFRKERERGLNSIEFEIQLRNKLTRRAVAKVCTDWMRRKTLLKSN